MPIDNKLQRVLNDCKRIDDVVYLESPTKAIVRDPFDESVYSISVEGANMDSSSINEYKFGNMISRRLIDFGYENIYTMSIIEGNKDVAAAFFFFNGGIEIDLIVKELQMVDSIELNSKYTKLRQSYITSLSNSVLIQAIISAILDAFGMDKRIRLYSCNENDRTSNGVIYAVFDDSEDLKMFSINLVSKFELPSAFRKDD